MKILFLTRVHPPITGGLENQSFNLVENFMKINKETYTIINKKGKKNLPLFIPYSFFKALYLIRKNKITHMHLSDGVMSFEGFFIKKLTGVKTIATIHGLDITYKNKLYQIIIPNCIKNLDKVICISNATKEECVKRNIPSDKCIVIPNGVNPDEFFIKSKKEELIKKLSKKFNISLQNKIVLLTTGRLVKRKGVEWFVNNVMPELNKDYIYLIAGDGEEKENIKNAINKNRLNDRVIMLGKVDNETLKILYNSADLFIMPNIHIKGDMEGFGLVALESGSCGLPVIASGIEGIKDAITNGKTGWLVKEKNKEDFISKIKSNTLSKNKVKTCVKNNFDWKIIAKRYAEVIE